MSELTHKIDKIEIVKLDNGYFVKSDTIRGNGTNAHYCSNLRGVTKELYRLFEGKSRLRKDQVEGVKGVLAVAKEKLEQKEESNDA